MEKVFTLECYDYREFCKAALLLGLEYYKDYSDIRVADVGETPNVTYKIIKEKCPDWVFSELMFRLVTGENSNSILYNKKLTEFEKLTHVREQIKKMSKRYNVELPS